MAEKKLKISKKAIISDGDQVAVFNLRQRVRVGKLNRKAVRLADGTNEDLAEVECNGEKLQVFRVIGKVVS